MIHLPTWYLQAYKGKVCPIHNSALHQEGTGRHGAVVLHVLTLYPTWRWMVSFTPWLLYL